MRIDSLFKVFGFFGVILFVGGIARDLRNRSHEQQMPVKRNRRDINFIRHHAETNRIYPVGVIRIIHYSVVGRRKQEVDPLFKVGIFLFRGGIVAVQFIRQIRHHKIRHTNRVCGSATRIERRGIAYLPARKLRVGYIARELGEEPRHIAVISRLIKSCAEVVEPAETLVALRAVGQNGMFVVMLGSYGYLVQIVKRFVRATETADYRRIGVNVFRDYLFKFDFSAESHFGILESVISKSRMPFFGCLSA